MLKIFSFCPHLGNTDNTDSTNNTINTDITLTYILINKDSTINTINKDNMRLHWACGSGKKYKQCCGK